MYLPFGKLCKKLFDVKCITFNSPLILRMNSIKFINTYSFLFFEKDINTYSIFLKLYKSQYY